jgi:hypothetical protein
MLRCAHAPQPRRAPPPRREIRPPPPPPLRQPQRGDLGGRGQEARRRAAGESPAARADSSVCSTTCALTATSAATAALSGPSSTRWSRCSAIVEAAVTAQPHEGTLAEYDAVNAPPFPLDSANDDCPSRSGPNCPVAIYRAFRSPKRSRALTPSPGAPAADGDRERTHDRYRGRLQRLYSSRSSTVSPQESQRAVA